MAVGDPPMGSPRLIDCQFFSKSVGGGMYPSGYTSVDVPVHDHSISIGDVSIGDDCHIRMPPVPEIAALLERITALEDMVRSLADLVAPGFFAPAVMAMATPEADWPRAMMGTKPDEAQTQAPKSAIDDVDRIRARLAEIEAERKAQRSGS